MRARPSSGEQVPQWFARQLWAPGGMIGAMSIWPVNGASGANLREALSHVSSGAINIFVGGNESRALIDKYLEWASEAVRMLRFVMRPEDLDRLVLTSRYWATLANPSPMRAVVTAVNDEILTRQRELDAALKELDKQIGLWMPHQLSRHQAYVVPDTNVLLQGTEALPDIDWHTMLSDTVRILENIHVVVPLLVIDELDNAKSGKNRSRARQTLRSIYEQFGANVSGRWIVRQATASSGEISVQLLLDPPGHTRLAMADDELVDRAAALQSFLSQPVDFVSYDTGAALRAANANLRVHRLQHES